MKAMTKTLPKPRATARELLEIVAGTEHSIHSVTSRDSNSWKDKIAITCSCGEVFKMAYSAEAADAVRNVPERGAH